MPDHTACLAEWYPHCGIQHYRWWAGCIVITLYRDGKTVFSIQRPTVNGVHTIDVPSITEQFNDATMTMMGSTELHTEFKVYTIGQFK